MSNQLRGMVINSLSDFLDFFKIHDVSIPDVFKRQLELITFKSDLELNLHEDMLKIQLLF